MRWTECIFSTVRVPPMGSSGLRITALELIRDYFSGTVLFLKTNFHTHKLQYC